MKNIEFDFLTEHEKDLAMLDEIQDCTKPKNKERLPYVQDMIDYHHMISSQYVKTQNKNKAAFLQDIYPLLEFFAESNSAKISVTYSEDHHSAMLKIVSLSMMHNRFGEYEDNGILSLLFAVYKDYSINIKDGKYICIEFFIDLADKTKVADNSKEIKTIYDRMKALRSNYEYSGIE